MLNEQFAKKFAEEWIAGWNSHNLERILSHYSDDFVIETPMTAKIFPESKGIVAGKEAVRKYWTVGLEKIPNLHFKLLDVLTGINGITIYYENAATGRRCAENLFFNEDGKVNKCFVHYS